MQVWPSPSPDLAFPFDPHAGVAIAQALGLNYAFLSEFEEIHSPLRDARSQVSRV